MVRSKCQIQFLVPDFYQFYWYSPLYEEFVCISHGLLYFAILTYINELWCPAPTSKKYQKWYLNNFWFDLYYVKKRFPFQINAVLFNFLFIKESWIKMLVSTKIWSSTTVLFTWIIMMFLEQKFSILERFLKDHVKIQLYHHKNKWHFKIYSNISNFKL